MCFTVVPLVALVFAVKDDGRGVYKISVVVVVVCNTLTCMQYLYFSPRLCNDVVLPSLSVNSIVLHVLEGSVHLMVKGLSKYLKYTLVLKCGILFDWLKSLFRRTIVL